MTRKRVVHGPRRMLLHELAGTYAAGFLSRTAAWCKGTVFLHWPVSPPNVTGLAEEYIDGTGHWHFIVYAHMEQYAVKFEADDPEFRGTAMSIMGLGWFYGRAVSWPKGRDKLKAGNKSRREARAAAAVPGGR